MLKSNSATQCVAMILFIFNFGCSSSSTSTASSSNITTSFKVNGITSAASSMLNLQEVLTEYPNSTAGSDFSALTTGTVGASGVGATNISSLQLYITSIQMCTSLTPNGSGYSGTSGCTQIFGSSSAQDYTYTVAKATSDTSTTNWVDLMSKSSISSFTSTATGSAAAGTYNYVIVESKKPVRLNAQFTENGVTLATCSGGTVSSSGSGSSLIETVTVSNMTTCTRGLVNMGSVGGGHWFKLQNPVTVDSTSTYSLDLAFNADNAVIGGLSSAFQSNVATYTDGTYSMRHPGLDVAPILRKSTQNTIREEYSIALNDLNGSLIVDLYYAGALTDVGTGTILGAQTHFVPGSGSTSNINGTSIYSITSTGSGLSFIASDGSASISNLVRSTTQTAGGTQTLNMNEYYLDSSGASSATNSYTATFNGVLQM